MLPYCLKCKKDTKDVVSKVLKTKDNCLSLQYNEPNSYLFVNICKNIHGN